MTEVKCGWSACKWNTAHVARTTGFCMMPDIELSHIQVYNKFDAMESGMTCKAYEENLNKFREEK